MNREAFRLYLDENNHAGSKKAPSYLRAIDLLSQMLSKEAYVFPDCIDLWSVSSTERLQALYEFVLTEAKRGKDTPWYLPDASSYLKNGYCSAALRMLQEFLVEDQHTQQILECLEQFNGEESDLAARLNTEPGYPGFLVENSKSKDGKERIATAKVRIGQTAFRKMILRVYENRCCITGLDIPTVNRASHIIGWSDPKGAKIRMDPMNGLCLSATYDAAFDKHLISLDNENRIILSKDIKEHYTSSSVQTYFRSKEGDTITLPDRYRPKQEYLDHHRSKGAF